MIVSAYEHDPQKLLALLLATEDEEDFKSGLCAAVGILAVQEARIKKIEDTLSKK